MVSKKKKKSTARERYFTIQVGLRLPNRLVSLLDDMVEKNAVFRSRSHLIYLAIAEYCANRTGASSVEEFHNMIHEQEDKRGRRQNELDL